MIKSIITEKVHMKEPHTPGQLDTVKSLLAHKIRFIV